MILVLGLTSAIAVGVVFASCRSCVAALRALLRGNPFQSGGYRSFYGYHSHPWWAFDFFVIKRVIMGVTHTWH